MKKLLCYTLIAIFSSTGYAKKQSFTFKYRYQNQDFVRHIAAEDSYTALEIAAKDCFSFYQNRLHNSERSTEQQGLDLIDVCANPR